MGLLTVQKVLPLIILVAYGATPVLLISAVMCGLVRVGGRVSCARVVKLMAYSSVFSLSWLLFLVPSPRVLLFNLACYTLSVGAVFIAGRLKPNYAVSHAMGATLLSVRHSVGLGLLSLAGLPPTVGFIGKLVALARMARRGC